MKGIAQINIGDYFTSPFTNSGGNKTIADIITLVLNSSIAIAGIIFLVLLIGAGISIIAGAGSGKSDDLEKGKKTATTALIGFLIVVFAWFILRLVEVVFLRGSSPFTSPENYGI